MMKKQSFKNDLAQPKNVCDSLMLANKVISEEASILQITSARQFEHTATCLSLSGTRNCNGQDD